jgi:hypothetical protein
MVRNNMMESSKIIFNLIFIMKEKDFFDTIDCKFPYNDLDKSIDLFKISSNISDNAVY